MILVDTSIWIEYLKGNSPYYEELASRLDSSQIMTIEAIFAELLQGAKSKQETSDLLELFELLPKLSTEGLVLNAGALSAKHKFYARGLSMTDCLIIATAIEYSCDIWTLDKKLQKEFEKLLTK